MKFITISALFVLVGLSEGTNAFRSAARKVINTKGAGLDFAALGLLGTIKGAEEINKRSNQEKERAEFRANAANFAKTFP